jgi:hypothetical protein
MAVSVQRGKLLTDLKASGWHHAEPNLLPGIDAQKILTFKNPCPPQG